MARPDCPRCGSDLVVAALPDSPSEWVEELRGGNVRARPAAGRSVNWLCRACGNRWDPPPDPGSVSAEVAAELEPHADHSSGAETEAHPGAILREHAKLLQLQPERSLTGSARAPRRASPALQPFPDPRDRRGFGAAAMTLVAVAALVVIASLPPRSAPEAELPETSGAPVRVHDSGRAPPPPAQPERRGLRAVLDVRQPCWVGVLADGEVVASITLVPGEAVVYRADRDLQLTLGNAGGVKLRVNDEPVRTGSPGEVVVLDFSWQRGEVLIGRA